MGRAGRRCSTRGSRDEPRVLHRRFAWDRADGVAGAAREEFGARGYDVEETYGLVAERLEPHPRESHDVEVRELDRPRAPTPTCGKRSSSCTSRARDEGHPEDAHRDFTRAWLADRRGLFRAGRGAWYVAVDPETSRSRAAAASS